MVEATSSGYLYDMELALGFDSLDRETMKLVVQKSD